METTLMSAVTPTVILLIVTPMITLIPLLILWLGNDPNVRIVVVVWYHGGAFIGGDLDMPEADAVARGLATRTQ